MVPAETNTGKQAGFTLIEIIAVLILIGVLAVMAGSSLVAAVQGYFLAQESTALSQKAQLGLNRLTKEYRLCYDCNDTSPDEFTNFLGERTITLENQELKINGDVLVDQVKDFELNSADGLIDITLELNHRQADTPLTFKTRVFPRNSYD